MLAGDRLSARGLRKCPGLGILLFGCDVRADEQEGVGGRRRAPLSAGSSDRPSLAQLGALHDRLPIPLAPGTIDAWLDPRDQDGLGLLDLVRGEAYDVAADWALRPVELVKDDDGRQRLETVANPIV